MPVHSAPKERRQTTNDWLKATGNKPNKKYCRTQITSHVYYPALCFLFCFLNFGAKASSAAQAHASCFYKFSYDVLAHIHRPWRELFVNHYLGLMSEINKMKLQANGAVC